MLKLIPPEQMYHEIDDLISAHPNVHRSVIVPGQLARERLLKWLTLQTRVLQGVDIVTLDGFAQRLAPFHRDHSSGVTRLQLRDYLRKLPDTHPIVTLKDRADGAARLEAAARELVETGVSAPPDGLLWNDHQYAKWLIDLRIFAEALGINQRAQRYRNVARILQQQRWEELDQDVVSGHVIVAGFYDLSAAQVDFFDALIEQRKSIGCTVTWLLPIATNPYGAYSKRLLTWLEEKLGDAETTITVGRIERRLAGVYALQPECTPVVAIDEPGEIDAILRVAIEKVVHEGIPLFEQAIALPAKDPYETLLREACARHGIPLRFTSGELAAQTGFGRKIALLFEWWRMPEDRTVFLQLLLACGAKSSSQKLYELISKYYAVSLHDFGKQIRTLIRADTCDADCTLLDTLSELSSDRFSKRWLKELQSRIVSMKLVENEDDEFALRQFLQCCNDSLEWMEYDPKLSFAEWSHMLSEAWSSVELNAKSAPAGIVVATIHELRGALFQVVHCVGGGAVRSGAEGSPLISGVLRTAWNREQVSSRFETSDDREIESRWLFALSLAQGEKVVVTKALYHFEDGKEQAEPGGFIDFARSVLRSDNDGNWIDPLLTQYELSKRISLSIVDHHYCQFRAQTSGVKLSGIPLPIRFPPACDVTRWGDLSNCAGIQESVKHLYTIRRWYDLLSCPLRAWFSYMLPIQVTDRSDRYARLRGEIVHAVLQDWRGDPAIAASTDWSAIIEKKLQHFHIPDESIAPFERALVAKECLARLAVWYKLATNSEWKQVAGNVEQEVAENRVRVQLTLPNGEETAFSGIIDWYGELTDGDAAIVDYKTGKLPLPKLRSFTETKILQGPLYAAAVAAAGWRAVSKVGWMYLHPKASGIDWIAVDALQTAQECALQLISEMRRVHGAGWLPATPIKMPGEQDSICSRCNFHTVCGARVFELCDREELLQTTGMQWRRSIRSDDEATDAE